MIYELFLEGELADVRQDLGMQLNFNIDDINKYGSRDTSFSKTIVLPGTARNNKLLGFVGELGSNNPYAPGAANINVNFNVAQTTKAELRANGLLLLKGVFRLTGIIHEKGHIEYEGNLFGELGGFIAAIGRGKLEELDFSAYNHTYTYSNIVSSWDGKTIFNTNAGFYSIEGVNVITFDTNRDYKLKEIGQITITNAFVSSNNKTYTVLDYIINIENNVSSVFVLESVSFSFNDAITVEFTRLAGTGYYYPLIDYGTYSANKINYDYRTFRPALYVKEYINKMFEGSGYTYESSFFNSSFFKKLIVPCNVAKLTKIITDLIEVKNTTNQPFVNLTIAPITSRLNFQSPILLENFSVSNNNTFTYTGIDTEISVTVQINGNVNFTSLSSAFISFGLRVGPSSFQPLTQLQTYSRTINGNSAIININRTIILNIKTNDILYIQVGNVGTNNNTFVSFSSLSVRSTNPIIADISLNDNILFNQIIPRNILQKDFFVWIMKMFNLYVTEDKVKQKHLLIEPYVDYYDLSDSEDWTYKVARDKAWNIKPMGMLNGRFFEYKYKDDNDFYNESYKKKYNLPYGSRLEDTGFQFAKDKQTIEIGFSPTVLVQYQGRDKIVPVIYKKSSGNAVDQEERMDSNIRILMAKKITGVASWSIVNTGASQNSPPVSLGAALTAYGYAGHFDDPNNPTKDINFGAASEIYFDPNVYPTNNLFNDYWSGYIAEIADKDSKLLSCHVYLTDLDIAQLDFSKPVFIDGVLWRINKVMDYDASSSELTKVELLKVINNG